MQDIEKQIRGSFWEDWMAFLSENWMWFMPVVATLISPLIGAGANALYDYLKLKRVIR